MRNIEVYRHLAVISNTECCGLRGLTKDIFNLYTLNYEKTNQRG